MKIKFIHDYQQHKDGDEVEMPTAQARLMIFRGYAQAMPSEPATATAVSAHAAEAVKPVKREKVVSKPVPLVGTQAEP